MPYYKGEDQCGKGEKNNAKDSQSKDPGMGKAQEKLRRVDAI